MKKLLNGGILCYSPRLLGSESGAAATAGAEFEKRSVGPSYPGAM